MTINLQTSKNSSYNLPELQELFLKQLRQEGKSANTLKNYKTDLQCFNQYIKEYYQSLDLGHFQTQHIVQYGHYLERKYQSDNSRRRRVQALRRFFDHLVAMELFKQNPVKEIPSSPKFLDIPKPTPFIDLKTLWEYLIQEAKRQKGIDRLKAKRNQVMVLCIFHGALKVSDLGQLKTSDIITVDDHHSDTRIKINHPKRDPYTIPLPLFFKDIYQDYLKELEVQKELMSKSFDHVFFNANAYKILSGGLSSRGFEVIFQEYRKKLLIDLTPKSLRQSCIFNWIHKGHPDGLIKEWMGVAPSYDLKLYKKHANQHLFQDHFLEEIYYHKEAKS